MRRCGRWGLAVELRKTSESDFGDGTHVKFFDFGAGPRSAAEELETGFDAGVEIEAADVDAAAKFGTSVFFDELCEDHFQGDPVQRIFGFGRRLHGDRM